VYSFSLENESFDRLYNTAMALLQEDAPSCSFVIARTIAAFCLNLIAATSGLSSLARDGSRLIHVHWPWMSIVQRQFLMSIVCAALAAFCVSKFWSTTTAKWVWIVPLPFLLVRMAIYSMHPTPGSAMQSLDPGLHYGLWRHFFSPDLSRDYQGFADFVVTTVTVRATIYSLTAWALARWERSRLGDHSIEPTSDQTSPMKPAFWPAPKLPWFSATNLLIGINLAVFAAMVVSGDSFFSSFFFPGSAQLVHWGAYQGARTLNGEPWRLITGSFLHWGFDHLATNMILLWWIGRITEKIVGPLVVTGVYLFASIGPALLKAALHPLSVSAGASASILGITGFLIAIVFHGKVKPPHSQMFNWRLAIFIFLFLVAIISPNVDNFAHVGGFATGLLLGLIFVNSLRASSPHRIFLPTRLFEARNAIEKEDYFQAIEQFQVCVEADPKAAEPHALLGYSFHALQRYDDAAREYKLAQDLGYTNEVINNHLHQISNSSVTTEDGKATATGGLS
jgi:membrane associated rhomboid family serine protease